MLEWRYIFTILDLGTRWKVVTLHALAALPREEWTRYSLVRRENGPQSRSGRCGEEKNLTSGRQTCSLLSYSDSYTYSC
jgi:hypothetical protein